MYVVLFLEFYEAVSMLLPLQYFPSFVPFESGALMMTRRTLDGASK